MKRKLVYIAHPLGDGAEREANMLRASKWVAWAADQGTAPVCTWIVLASQWSEARREDGLDIDCALVERCDEVWAVGPRVSPGMHVELTHAKKHGVPVHVLVNPLFADGPPQRRATFDELVRSPEPPTGKVIAYLRKMANHHNIPYEEFITLSQAAVIALELENPTPKSEINPPKPVASPLEPKP